MDLNEFIRQNEKMNSSLITDWSREMILEAFQIWTDKQLLKHGVVKSSYCEDGHHEVMKDNGYCGICNKKIGCVV